MDDSQEFVKKWDKRVVEVRYAQGPNKGRIVDLRGKLMEYKGNLYLRLHMDVAEGTELVIKDAASNNKFSRYVRELLSSEVRPYMVMIDNDTGALYYYEMYLKEKVKPDRNAVKNMINSARNAIMKLLGRN